MVTWLVVFILQHGLAFHEIPDILGLNKEDSKVYITDFGENKGLGLIAKIDMKKGEPMVSVPLNYTYTSLSEFPLYSYVSDLETHTIAAVRLIYEKFSGEGFFHKFADTFLSDYNLRTFWSEDQVKVLYDYSLKVFEYQGYAVEWESEYEEVKRRLKDVEIAPKEIFNLTEWIWSYSCACCKTFDIWANQWKEAIGQKPEFSDFTKFIAFNIPLIDLANHFIVPIKDQVNQVYYLAEFNGTASLMAQTNFQKGSEIFLEYEKEGNNHYMTIFGFASEHQFYEEFFFNKTTNTCTEKKMGNQCQWVLKMYELNERLLNFYFIEEKDELKALYAYRSDMFAILNSSKYSLRETKRNKELYNWKYIAAFNYAICQRNLILGHIRFLDKRIMKRLLAVFVFETGIS